MRIKAALRGMLAVATGAAAFVFAAPAAYAAFGVANFDAGTCALNTEPTPECTSASPSNFFYQQAAGHPPYGITAFTFNTTRNVPDDEVQNLRVDLPPGLSVNPEATPKCTRADLARDACAPAARIGVNYMTVSLAGNPVTIPVNVFNIEQPDGMPSLFGINVSLTRQQIYLEGGVAWDSDYHESFTIRNIPTTIPLIGSRLIFNGQAGDGTFITLPSPCEGPQTTTLRVNSYEDPDTTLTYTSTTPLGVIGCEDLPFDPTIAVTTDTQQAGAPAGVTVDVNVPQNPDGTGRPNSSTLRDVSVALPEGMSLNPSVATGLEACTDEQFGQGTTNPVSCPESSVIGTVEIETPVLPAGSLTGDVYVGQPLSNDPQSGQEYRLFLDAESARYGVSVRLTGQVRADPVTGRLTAMFDENPQTPASMIRVALRGGDRSVLVNPPTCGTHTAQGDLLGWGGQTAAPTTTVTIDQGCGPLFAPGFSAGVSNPLSGVATNLGVRVNRTDADQPLSRIDVSLPPGLLAKTAGIPLCPDSRAAAGTCEESSRIGSVAVTAGAGASPFSLGGRVYLTGPYGGGPYGLSVVVPAVAGPYNLGTVVVRAAILIDRNDAHVRALSDPMPTILGGVPLLVRSVDVSIDRPDTMRNPTNCTTRQVVAGLTSTKGLTSGPSAPLAATECGRLAFSPRLALGLTGVREVREGRHPGVTATVTQPTAQAHLRQMKVTLPLSLALDPDNAEALCEYTAGLQSNCPAASVIGTATAHTPLLPHPLTGNVYFVKGIRTDARGRQIKTLPTLLVSLRGDIALDLRATSDVDSKSRLVSTFSGIPDAEVSSFEMKLRGGKHGILVVTSQAGLCNGRKQKARTVSTGQNGRVTGVTSTLKTPCAKTPRLGRPRAISRGRVRIGVIAPGTGRIVATGTRGRLGRVSRVARARHRVVLTLKPTRRAARQLARTGRLVEHVTVSYITRGGASSTVSSRMVILRP